MRISNGIQNRNRRMRNRTYGGVRGRKTKVGRKLLRFPPTRLETEEEPEEILENFEGYSYL